ncbi:Protein of unknown function [Propionibacterium freudenreichii subsp. freudenreichii]|uniref:Uncharacterized protein n=1 Tax=Propionibacterium freudenreichii subsp. freudenreichii TaxID=66712 RepID=A0A0B7NVN9_PROFF|nr:Protein of unknown function [Propionibacterium freudenreichii subsp. freudenreichii]
MSGPPVAGGRAVGARGEPQTG